jgi:hypothetical protein
MEKKTFASVVKKVEEVIRPIGFILKKVEEKYDKSKDDENTKLFITFFRYGDSSAEAVSALYELIPRGFEITNICRNYDPSVECIYKCGQKLGLLVTVVHIGELN